MKKYLFVTYLILSQLFPFAQIDSVFARIEITSFSIHEHRPFIDTSIVIVLEKLGRSDIIKLGTIDEIEAGIQLELLKSYLGEKETLVNGIAFYIKKDGKWQLHGNPTYHSSEYKRVSQKPLIIPKDYGMATTTIQGFQIDYKQHYFVLE